jgi:Domain of unknown function (DUF6438)
MFQRQLISLILLLVVCGGCRMAASPGNQDSVQSTPTSPAVPLAQAVPSDTEIVLERQRCDLRCPVYKLTISADGSVVYNGRLFVKQTGIVKSSIGKERLSELIAEIERINYFSLKDKYIPGAECPQVATDYPTAIISVSLNGRSKTIQHYHGCTGADVLQQLTDLESKIDRVVDTEQWIN